MTEIDAAIDTPRLAWGAVGWAWLATIAVDFLAYGGVFAGLFVEGNPSVLSPTQLFARIPAGYLSFLIEVVALAWLLRRLAVTDPAGSARVGAMVGATFGAALAVGVWSFAPISVSLLSSWWLVLTVQLAAAGWVLGAGASGLRSLARRTVIWSTVAAIAVTIVLQNL